MPPPPRKKLALVLSGGGARGAYEAGIIHYIRTMLPPKIRERQFDIQCGSSVGAINTSFMSSTAHDAKFQGEEILRLWAEMKEENIYRRDMGALWHFISKSSVGIMKNLFKGYNKNGNTHFQGFLDTTPFIPFLERSIPWSMISKNIQSGLLRAISLSTTNIATGKMELFIEKSSEVEYTGEYVTHFTKVRPIHAAASSAIPIAFPTIMINGISYADGGLRLNTPMSPAIQLGADAILVIGLHYHAKPGQKPVFRGEKGKPATLGQVLGRVMNTIFLDRIQYDIEQLERINRVIDWSEMLYGDTYIKDLNKMLEKKNIRGDIANRGLKRLQVMRLSPSEDVGDLFTRCFERGRDSHFSSMEKFLVRFLDIDPTSGNDFLSYLSFMPEYIQELISLGFEDAKKSHAELEAFLDQ